MDQLTLGIGTRLQHTQYGPGVIVGVKYAVYLISFIHHGLKEINKEDSHLDEIIPENATAEIETASEAERSLLGILRLWGGLSEVVPLGDLVEFHDLVAGRQRDQDAADELVGREDRLFRPSVKAIDPHAPRSASADQFELGPDDQQ